MGLKITTSLHTNKGNTTEMYINIETITLIKDNLNVVRINKYLNKSSRDSNPKNTVDCFEISPFYKFTIPVELFNTKTIHSIIYDELKTLYRAVNLTVTDI